MIHWLASQVDGLPEWVKAAIVIGAFILGGLDIIKYVLSLWVWFLRRKVKPLEIEGVKKRRGCRSAWLSLPLVALLFSGCAIDSMSESFNVGDGKRYVGVKFEQKFRADPRRVGLAK